LIDEVSGWLAVRNIPPVGAPFWKYNVIDMEGELEVEVGVPVATEVSGDERVRGGPLPAGRYATLHHVGHPDTLVDANAALLAWARDERLAWDMD
jgi:effector-binding domain-containing protein